MELSPRLAQTLANITLGWCSKALYDRGAVSAIESALRYHGQDDLIVPAIVWDEDRTR